MTKPDDRTPNPQRSPERPNVYVPPFENVDWYTEVKKGNIPGHSVIQRFGRNDSVPTSWAYINPDGNNNWQRQAASPIRIAAGTAADNPVGLGAREITIAGLDASLQPVQITLPTNGTSPSAPSSESFLRINGAWVSSAGTYAGSNSGDVVIESADGSTQLVRIVAGTGESANGNASTTSGNIAYLLSSLVTMDANKEVSLRARWYPDIDNTVAPFKGFRQPLLWTGVTEPLSYVPPAPLGPISEESDFWWEGQSAQSTAAISVEFEMLIVASDQVLADESAFAEQF